MQIVERRVGDVTILGLIGRLELEEGVLALRDRVNSLIEQSRVNLVLDMKEVTRLDSAGIGTLVSRLIAARRRGGTIKLLRLTEHTSHLVHITKLSTVFEIFDDEDEAVRSFGAAPAGG